MGDNRGCQFGRTNRLHHGNERLHYPRQGAHPRHPWLQLNMEPECGIESYPSQTGSLSRGVRFSWRIGGPEMPQSRLWWQSGRQRKDH